jgi:hypothetical protein
MNSAIGIDLGTFHTVSVLKSQEEITLPSRSVPSIAVILGKTPVVGVDAIQQINLANRLIIAPKLKLHDHSEPKELITTILRKLVEQSTKDLGVNIRNTVMTVPPGWNLEDCLSIQESVSVLGFAVCFIHEPIALLAAVFYLSRKKECNPSFTGRLATAKQILVCDWGAGTVDIALIEVSHKPNSIEFRCLGEKTILGEGGTNMATDIIQNVDKKSDFNQIERMSFSLQAAWQGMGVSSFNLDKYQVETSKRRLNAAKQISKETADLLDRLCIDNRSEMVTLLYGGPMESMELRKSLLSEFSSKVGLLEKNALIAGSDFLKSFSQIKNIRRDCLVAAGASIYGSNGEALPEFEYDIILKDSFGKPSSKIKLIKDKNLEGIQVITPPFTGVDYFVEVHQIINRIGVREKTPISAELKLHIRKGAVVMYRIAEAGVGYAIIEASEAKDLPYPELFENSRQQSVVLPEKSTRFSISFS